MSRVIGLAILLAIALALGGCPPPPPPGAGNGNGTGTTDVSDGNDTADEPDAGGDPTTGNTTPKPREPGAREPVEAASPGARTVRESARLAETADVPARVVYERLRGGVSVPRCPSCGETQAEGAEACPGCGQAIVPWRRETLCAHCTGSGACGRCGDDRPCLACDGDGRCTTCDGSGQLDDRQCGDCGGKGRCLDCGGDAWRESVRNDFRPGESFLPGVCPTCIDGAGLCPDCGASGKDAAGETCMTCAGDLECPDCSGSGSCAHDRGDGLCRSCGGGGRIVVNGAALSPAERLWSLREADGRVIPGRLTDRPAPNVMVQMTRDKKMEALVPDQVHPITYFMAVRDFTPLDDAQGRMELATIALQRGLLPLAEQELRRAAAADRALASRSEAQLREVESRRITAWLERADAALEAGDRERAMLLLRMVRVRADGTDDASTAIALLERIRTELEAEQMRLGDAARERAQAARDARVARTVKRARWRLERARAALRPAREAALAASGVVRLLDTADRAAWDAERLVRSDAHALTPGVANWPESPADLVATARALRAEIALARAVHEVAVGRFAVGAAAARRVLVFDPGNARANDVLAEAELGMVRRGVLIASPPPVPRDGGDR